MQDTTPPSFRLSIPGLPSLTDRMMNGGLYALIAATPPARFPILGSSLAAALNDGVPCTIILPSQAEAFVERIDSFAQFNTAKVLASGQLQIFTLQDNFAKNMFRFGAESFARELSHFEIPPNSYLVFDQADELFSLHDVSLAMEQVEILKQWFDEAQVTALLAFSRLTTHAADTLHAMMDQLSGIVRIGGDRSGLELVFDYWKSPEGTIAAKQHSLAMLESGLYRVAGRPITADREQASADELLEDGEARFFYMDPELAALANQLPGAWQHVDSLVGMMHSTRGIHSPSVILSFRRETGLRELAEAVHTLRLSLGRRARIVVRETGASLRYQNEALLLRLGVNLVVHRDVPASRLPLLLASLAGQSFDRNVDINFEAALASVMPSALRGYLLPARFAREVETIIERSATLDIPCALVIGKPAQDVPIDSIMGSIDMARPGDLNSSDGASCYLFFSGCPESVLLMTMERILGRPIDAAFSESRFVVRTQEIRAELATFSSAASNNELSNDQSSQAGAARGTTGARREPQFTRPPRSAIIPAELTGFVAGGSLAASRSELAQDESAAEQPLLVEPGAILTDVVAQDAVRSNPLVPDAAAPTDAVPAMAEPVPAQPAFAQPMFGPAAPARDRPRFKFPDNANDSTFGRNDAPRATRAARPAAAPPGIRKTPASTK